MHTAWTFSLLVLIACNGLACSSTTHVSHSPYPAHSKAVWVTEDTLQGVPYEVIGTVETQKQWYGSDEDCYAVLADLARDAGADAVIAVATGRRVTAFSWASPHAHGTAIKLRSGAPIDWAAHRAKRY